MRRLFTSTLLKHKKNCTPQSSLRISYNSILKPVYHKSITFKAEKKSMSTFVNKLAKEKSPYLLQHQYDPVEWYENLI